MRPTDIRDARFYVLRQDEAGDVEGLDALDFEADNAAEELRAELTQPLEAALADETVDGSMTMPADRVRQE